MLAFVTMTAGDAYAGMGPHGEADNSEVGDEAAGSLTATRLGKRLCAGNAWNGCQICRTCVADAIVKLISCGGSDTIFIGPFRFFGPSLANYFFSLASFFKNRLR
jgi:hypothetical protein